MDMMCGVDNRNHSAIAAALGTRCFFRIVIRTTDFDSFQPFHLLNLEKMLEFAKIKPDSFTLRTLIYRRSLKDKSNKFRIIAFRTFHCIVLSKCTTPWSPLVLV